MKKDINVVTSLVGAGLEREYLLLREFLMSHGHYVVGMHYTNLSAPMVRSDITIFLEVVMPQALNLARENWLIPNSEWWDSKNDVFLPRFSRILCKTKDCYDIWSKKVGPQKCVYTSFEARDIYRPEITREPRCLHIAGKSEHKNTEAVCRAWRMTRCQLPPLTIVARAPIFVDQWKEENKFPSDVTHINQASDEEIIQLMNSHQIHIIPSMYEGFGHCIHEGLGCGALVVTTDAAPMNAYDGILRECLVPVSSKVPRALANMNHVSGVAVSDMVWKATDFLSEKVFEAKSQAARAAFLTNREFFRTKLLELVDGKI